MPKYGTRLLAGASVRLLAVAIAVWPRAVATMKDLEKNDREFDTYFTGTVEHFLPDDAGVTI